jgi:hypothetical protein
LKWVVGSIPAERANHVFAKEFRYFSLPAITKDPKCYQLVLLRSLEFLRVFGVLGSHNPSRTHMKRREIETWALRTIESVEAKHKVEDTNVELKREWIDPVKAARRLAGHANAARGEPILWLIGVDEEKGVTGAAAQDLSVWLPAVQAEFNGAYPDLQDVSVDHDGKRVPALCFSTDRAPYVVRNPAFGGTKGEGVRWEVPWRDGTLIRTATRNELLLLLVPNSSKPKVDILDCCVECRKGSSGLHLSGEAYVVPSSERPCVFPYHRTSALIKLGWDTFEATGPVDINPAGGQKVFVQDIIKSMRRPDQPRPVTVNTGSKPIEATQSEITIRQPGMVRFSASFEKANARFTDDPMDVTVSLVEVVAEHPVTITIKLKRAKDTPNGPSWEMDCSRE